MKISQLGNSTRREAKVIVNGTEHNARHRAQTFKTTGNCMVVPISSCYSGNTAWR
ncbi:hypothetical protein LP421_30060 (plasmid) [Rhizobium sp. RCAM05350]|nr:hypothetical protein LP421_30060 [Rhizobium sp. RCAM05350]